ncbi:transmembrane protein 92-like [Mastomys coucha]|uniref:transmembrane protein 92-like n=1 Tax=Mastomys coucha TaxID=35658 RepID=UPI0012624477|nr:transmembrane protein 92-like [Mastomys coucha]
MQDTWVPGTLPLIFGLLSSLQPVSANRTVNTCDILSCPEGFTCCENECCLQRNIWDPAKDPFRILFILTCIIFPLLCICGLVRHFCPSCRELQHDFRTADHHIPPEPPSIAPLESIWVTSLGPPPSYSQVVLNSTPTELPPPYSLRSKGPADQMGGHAYATL